MHRFVVTLAAALAGAPPLAHAAPPAPGKPAEKPRPAAKTPAAPLSGAKGYESLRALADATDFTAASATATKAFDDAIAASTPEKPADLRDAALGARLSLQLAKIAAPARAELLTYLRDHADAAADLAFLIDPRRDDAQAAWALFDPLRKERGAKAERLSAFVAALCVVRDKPIERHINENTVHGADPLQVFDYFERNEGKMLFPLRGTPPELLVYVADSTASPDEMNWALSRYARSGDVGAKFFDIQYDLEAFYHGADKKVTREGYSLPNIFKCGGVCADQAYFAASVGKAIGTPSAYVVALGAEGGHAWVGFLDGNPKNAHWNFDAGRYDEFKNNKGLVENPQTGRQMADSNLGLLAELLNARDEDRHAAVALADAAARLAQTLPKAAGGASRDDPAPSAAPAPPPGVPASLDAVLGYLEAALRKNAACVPAWDLLSRLAAEDRLSLAQKQKWAEAVRRLCGAKYPDFALDVLTPMVETIDDAKDQDRIWNALFMDFGKRADLGARIRLAQARMWQKQKDTTRALITYREVIDKYLNIGPSAIDALAASGALLFMDKKQDQALALMDTTWKKMPRPSGAVMFQRWSNWSRAGQIYATALSEAGKTEQANKVLAELGFK